MAPKKKAANKKEESAAAVKAEEKAEEEDKKRKAEERKEEEPPKKEAKTEEAKTEEPAAEDAKMNAEPEAPVEREKDAPADKRAGLKEPVCFHSPDTALNVVPTSSGALACLTEGGIQYLIAGARASVGLKAGRYMFEVKIIEVLNPTETWSRNQGPMPRQLLRVGLSTAGSSLVLGDSEDHVCFDTEGNFTANKRSEEKSKKFGRDQVMAVLLNLDPKSPNKNTVSLFCNGERVAQPQPLPENLLGKPLFPHVSFRNVTVQTNFSPHVWKELPFKCRTVGGAAAADSVVSPKSEPKDGKYEVMIPVGLPDQGTFEWLDMFLAKNPQYVELSDRKVLQWAAASGLWKPEKRGWKHCNDKPEFNFGVGGMDDFSVRRLLNAVAPIVPRNYVVMEVQRNLQESERKETLKRFNFPHFKQVAHVVMGEPSEEYKQLQHEKLLNIKQEKEDQAWKNRQREKLRKKTIEMRQKQLAEKKAEQESEKKDEDAEKKEDGDGKEEEKKAGEKKDDPMEVEEETEPPKAELTEEEKKTWFCPPATNDLTTYMLEKAFAHFSVPEKSEGFQEVRFEWQKEGPSKEYLRKWVMERKRSTRIENLAPSQWFYEKLKEWQKLFAEWQAKQVEHKAVATSTEAKKVEGEDAEEEGAEGEGAGGEEEQKQVAKQDIMSVEDVCNAAGAPLFKDFAFEDWALLQLRYELFLLQYAFKKDVNDTDHPGVHEQHIGFYYTKYFKKQLNPKLYGAESMKDVVKLVGDAMEVEDEILRTTLTVEPDDMARFVKIGETTRRERERRLSAGDETARVKIEQLVLQQPVPAPGSVLPQAVPAPRVGVVAPAGWQSGASRQQWHQGKDGYQKGGWHDKGGYQKGGWHDKGGWNSKGGKGQRRW